MNDLHAAFGLEPDLDDRADTCNCSQCFDCYMHLSQGRVYQSSGHMRPSMAQCTPSAARTYYQGTAAELCGGRVAVVLMMMMLCAPQAISWLFTASKASRLMGAPTRRAGLADCHVHAMSLARAAGLTIDVCATLVLLALPLVIVVGRPSNGQPDQIRLQQESSASWELGSVTLEGLSLTRCVLLCSWSIT